MSANSSPLPVIALRFSAWVFLGVATLAAVLFLFGPAGFQPGVSPAVSMFSVLYALVSFGAGLVVWALLMSVALATSALLDIRRSLAAVPLTQDRTRTIADKAPIPSTRS